MPDMPQAELLAIEHEYARTVTDTALYRNNSPLAVLAIIQRAQAERERKITDIWTIHIGASYDL